MVVSTINFVCAIRRYGNRPLRGFGAVGTLLAWCVAGHLQEAEFVHLLGGQELPIGRIGMLSVEDGLKVEVAARGGTCSSHACNDFADLDGFPFFDRDCLKVVVGGDQAIAVIDLHPVAATPKVPAHGPDHAGVGRIDAGAAGSSKILPPMEFAGLTGQGARPKTEGGAGNQNFQRSHEGTGGRALHILDGNVQFMLAVLGRCPDYGAAIGNKGGRIGGKADGSMDAFSPG